MISRLIGMVHLAALPGAPGWQLSLESVIEAALSDATTLADAGFDALMIENLGDAPFYPDDAPKVTIAAMAVVADRVRRSVDLPVGVNVLRNDAMGALAVAAATGAAFIRVNVLSGAMSTDQGPIVGRAAEVARLRTAIAPNCQVLADVFVKHAVPPAGLTIEQAAVDLWERAGADAVVVSGAGTGQPVEVTRLAAVRSAIPDAPLFVGSGTSPSTVSELLTLADGVIVGSALKPDGKVDAPIDPHLAGRFVEAARG